VGAHLGHTAWLVMVVVIKSFGGVNLCMSDLMR
jgi:hypothetical protein